MGAGSSVVAEPIEVEVDAAPAPGELTSGRGVDRKQLRGECPSQRKAICATVSRRSDLVVVSGNLPFRKSMSILKRKGTYWLEEGVVCADRRVHSVARGNMVAHGTVRSLGRLSSGQGEV